MRESKGGALVYFSLEISVGSAWRSDNLWSFPVEARKELRRGKCLCIYKHSYRPLSC